MRELLIPIVGIALAYALFFHWIGPELREITTAVEQAAHIEKKPQ